MSLDSRQIVWYLYSRTGTKDTDNQTYKCRIGFPSVLLQLRNSVTKYKNPINK